MVISLLAIQLILYTVPGERFIEPEPFLQSVQQVQDFYRKNLGIHLKVRKIDERAAGPYATDLHSLESLSSWSYWLNLLRPTFRKNQITIVAHAPLYDQGRYWYAGLAIRKGIGGRQPFGIVWCGPDVSGCSIVLAHEIGHVLGAGDEGGACSIMHGAAGGCKEAAWRMSSITRTGIRRRLKRVKLWNRARRE